MQPRSAPSSQRTVGCRRWARAAASAATSGGNPMSQGVQAAVAPSSGSAASSGNMGRAPIETTVGETIVLRPTVKPGPSR